LIGIVVGNEVGETNSFTFEVVKGVLMVEVIEGVLLVEPVE
jgi:hypothetical protein